MPISRLSVTSCVGLEPRPLPSAGVTRLRRYYGPLRYPRRPSLSLAGVWLRGSTPSPIGFPVLRWISLYRHAVVITPVARWVLIARGTVYSNRFHSSPAAAAFPFLLQGRRPRWSFRGLLNVHACYGLSARRVATATRLSRRLRRFCYLHRRSDSYRLERPSCRVGIAPTEDQHLSTAHNRVRPCKAGLTPRSLTDPTKPR